MNKRWIAYFIVILFFSVIGLMANAAVNPGSLKTEIYKQLKAGNKKIIIPAGTYSVKETILIHRGFNNKEMIADGNVYIHSSFGGPIFKILGVSDFKISKFNFRSVDLNDPGNKIGFYYREAQESVSTSDSKVLIGSTAIFVVDSHDVTISSNQISGYFKGIYITAANADSFNVIVENNRITDCGYHSIAAHKGVSEDIRLENIQFKNNYIARCEQGPVFRAVEKSVMSGNEVVGNIVGIRVERSNNNAIVGNKVHHNMKNGIFLYGSSNKNHVYNNTIYDNNLQAERIVKLAKKHHCDPNYLPGDLVCMDRISRKDYGAYGKRLEQNADVLDYNPEFWPYPTVYEHITPGRRFGNPTPADYRKYWGIYFCQFSGVGIMLQHACSNNLIENNAIYNSAPLKMATGYMPYGIRIGQLGLREPEEYASRRNVFKNNKIDNMVKGKILDDNIKAGVKADNRY